MSFIRGNLTVTASDYWKSYSHAKATSPDSKDETLGSLGGAAAGLSCELDGIEHDILPVALALDAMRVESALLRDGGRIGENTMHASAGVAGGWAGAWIGGTTGAHSGELVGAGIGVMVGGPAGSIIGTAIGGTIGFVGGSIGGGIAGTKLGEKAADRAILRG